VVIAFFLATLAGSTLTESPLVVVNGQPIESEYWRAELTRRYESVALAELIDDQLLLGEAKRLKLKVDEMAVVRRMLAAGGQFTAAQARREWLLDELSPRLTVVSAEEIRLVYESNRSFFVEPTQVRVRDLVLTTQDNADQLAALLQRGGNFAELARTFSIDKASRDRGGDLGWLRLNTLVTPLRDTVGQLKPGEVSKPIELSGEWHLLKLEALKPERQKSLTDVRAEIHQRLLAEKHPMTRSRLLDSLRQRARITIR